MQEDKLCQSCHYRPGVVGLNHLCRGCVCDICHQAIKYDQSNFCPSCVCQDCGWNKREPPSKFCRNCHYKSGSGVSQLRRGREATDFRRGGTYAGRSTLSAPGYPGTLNSGVDEQEILDAQRLMPDPPLPVAGGMSWREALPLSRWYRMTPEESGSRPRRTRPRRTSTRRIRRTRPRHTRTRRARPRSSRLGIPRPRRRTTTTLIRRLSRVAQRRHRGHTLVALLISLFGIEVGAVVVPVAGRGIMVAATTL